MIFLYFMFIFQFLALFRIFYNRFLSLISLIWTLTDSCFVRSLTSSSKCFLATSSLHLVMRYRLLKCLHFAGKSFSQAFLLWTPSSRKAWTSLRCMEIERRTIRLATRTPFYYFTQFSPHFMVFSAPSTAQDKVLQYRQYRRR